MVQLKARVYPQKLQLKARANSQGAANIVDNLQLKARVYLRKNVTRSSAKLTL